MVAKSLYGAIKFILQHDYFDKDSRRNLICCNYEPSDLKYSKLLIITGDNAEGKSFFVKLFDEYCDRKINTECLRLGMSLRTEKHWSRSCIYKDESAFSTGDSSISSVIKGIETCQKREQEHYVIFDEPNLGLAESYHYALGEYFARFITDMPSLTKGMVIVTHSRELVRPLLDYHPHHLRFGDNQNIKNWVERNPKRKNIEELLWLPEKGRRKFKRVQEVSKELSKQ
jgi:hypothetical protein